MTALLLLLIPAALAAGTPDSRIVGGSNVNIADYPWQVTNKQFMIFIIYLSTLLTILLLGCLLVNSDVCYTLTNPLSIISDKQ